MSLMIDKKLINVGDGDDDNYKINVAEFIKSRHMNDVLNYKRTANNTSSSNVHNNNNNNNNQHHQYHQNQQHKTETHNSNLTSFKHTSNKESRIIINRYNVDDTSDNDNANNGDNVGLNENSVINQGDYRTHFIRKFKENKSRINTRNQYSAIYIKQPNIDKTWNSNHNTSGSSNNSNLLNDFRQLNPSILSSSNNDTSFNTTDSLINVTNDNKKHESIRSIEKWSSHINKANNINTGVHINNNSNNHINNRNKVTTTTTTSTVNNVKKKPPIAYNLLTHVISNPVERENTKESVSMQYDKPIDIHRDLIPTPHAYLKLNDEPTSNINRKLIASTSLSNNINETNIIPTFTTATLSTISNSTITVTNSNNNFDPYILRDDAPSPDTYVTINTPSKNISIYSNLKLPLSNTNTNSSINNLNNSNNLINSNKLNVNNRNKILNQKEDLTTPSTSYTKRRNTFSISPHKTSSQLTTPTVTSSIVNNNNNNNNNTKKSISFRKKNDDIEIRSRSTSPIFEDSSAVLVSSRRSKNSLINNKKSPAAPLFLSSSQQQIQPQSQLSQNNKFKSQSNTNISPRRNIVKKKSTLPVDKFSKQKFDPNNCELKEFKHCIITDLKIGEGEFGETFQGYRYDLGAPTKIAAKRLKNVKPNGEIDTTNIIPSNVNQLNNPNLTVANSSQNENILAEVCVLSQLGKHDFVIEYLGVHVYSETMYMVFEYAEKGDLKRLLDSCRKNTRPEININLLWKMKFAYEISAGMEYIASLGIVHKDLATRNILLQKDYSCKIADFGCCKTDFMIKRPIRWMSPESLNKSLFTAASDVWAFGIVLWEIWTLGVIPYPGMTDDEVVSRINQWYRLYKPHDCPNEIYNIMTQCWKEYYRARPRFTQISHRIKDLYETVIDKGTL